MLFRSAILFLVVFCATLNAQKNTPYIVLSGGPGYFFNGTSAQHYVNRGTTVGISYLFNKKKRPFIFNPGLNYSKNSYHTHMSNFQLVQVKQRLLSLNLDVLMRISKKNFLRIGLLISKEVFSGIEITQKNSVNRYIYGFSNAELYKSYSPAPIQAGVTFGICLPFKLFKRDNLFDIKAVHIASPVVGSDYLLTTQQVGEDVTVLTTRARPTMLLLALSFNIAKKEKAKSADDN